MILIVVISSTTACARVGFATDPYDKRKTDLGTVDGQRIADGQPSDGQQGVDGRQAADQQTPDTNGATDIKVPPDGATPSGDAGGTATIANLVIGRPPILPATFEVSWTSTALIVTVDVNDGIMIRDSGATIEDDDGIEVYLDMSHNHSATYQSDDFQLVAVWNQPKAWSCRQARAPKCQQDLPISATWSGGYRGVITIPWTALQMVPNVGLGFGFDVGVNFDQNGGQREGQLMWAGTADNFKDTRNFGHLTLATNGKTILSKH